MKKLLLTLWSALFIFWFWSSTFALSCAWFPTFEEMAEDAEFMFTGELIDKIYIEDTTEAEYCEWFWWSTDSSTLWTHTFTFKVDEVHAWNIWSEITVTKNVTWINCTWGGSCIDMDIGKSYKVITNSENQLSDWLCSACPYLIQEQEEELCMCTMQYDPVCWTDWNTYSNDCVLWCKWDDIEIDYRWECQQIQEWIDASCISWYDWCNNCSVENWKPTICTKKACFTQQRAKCTQYTYKYLNDTLLSFIETKLNNYLAAYSWTDKEVRIWLLIEKITSMKDKLLNTLATSSFIQWSKALRNIEITIEVLNALDSML